MAKICIDPGHFGKCNRSPGVPEYYESEMVWTLSYLQKVYLEQMGHTVIMTRTDPQKDLALVTRGKMAKGCDLFISNHSNAVGSYMNEKRSNVAIYHLVDDHTTECDDISKDFAYKIGPVIAEVMGLQYQIHTRAAQSDRNGDGFKNDNYYGVLHGSRLVKTPGLILEHGFHTHTATVHWLLNHANLEKLALAEARCIDQYFGKPTQEPIDEIISSNGEAVYHIVKRGETLGKIAQKYGTTVKVILWMNPAIVDPNKIYANQKIRVK